MTATPRETPPADAIACDVCDLAVTRGGRLHPCAFGAPRGLCSCWRGIPCRAGRRSGARAETRP